MPHFPKADEPGAAKVGCGSGFTAMRRTYRNDSRWNRSHTDDAFFGSRIVITDYGACTLIVAAVLEQLVGTPASQNVYDSV